MQRERVVKEKQAAHQAAMARNQWMLEADEDDSESDSDSDDELLRREIGTMAKLGLKGGHPNIVSAISSRMRESCKFKPITPFR